MPCTRKQSKPASSTNTDYSNNTSKANIQFAVNYGGQVEDANTSSQPRLSQGQNQAGSGSGIFPTISLPDGSSHTIGSGFPTSPTPSGQVQDVQSNGTPSSSGFVNDANVESAVPTSTVVSTPNTHSTTTFYVTSTYQPTSTEPLTIPSGYALTADGKPISTTALDSATGGYGISTFGWVMMGIGMVAAVLFALTLLRYYKRQKSVAPGADGPGDYDKPKPLRKGKPFWTVYLGKGGSRDSTVSAFSVSGFSPRTSVATDLESGFSRPISESYTPRATNTNLFSYVSGMTRNDKGRTMMQDSTESMHQEIPEGKSIFVRSSIDSISKWLPRISFPRSWYWRTSDQGADVVRVDSGDTSIYSRYSISLEKENQNIRFSRPSSYGNRNPSRESRVASIRLPPTIPEAASE